MKKKPRDLYYSLGENKFGCRLCPTICTGQPNASRHAAKHLQQEAEMQDPETPKDPLKEKFFHETPKGERYQIDDATVEILKWKNKYGISMSSICNISFKAFIKNPAAVRGKELMKVFQTDMATQIMQANKKACYDSVVSLIIDGGTVIQTKWLAIVKFGSSDEGLSFGLLDVIMGVQHATSDYIKDEIKQIAANLEKQNTLIISVCTDNARNLVSSFFNTAANSKNSKNCIENIIRISCACHSGQLIIADFLKYSPEFKVLVDLLKEIPQKICHKTKEEIKALQLSGYPPVQKQRWNSIHIALQYVIKNEVQLSKLCSTANSVLNDLEYAKKMELLLRPLHIFTTKLEGNDKTQADVYKQYIKLKNAWEEMAKTNNDAKKLLEFLEKRSHKTFDIELAEMAYSFTCQGMHDFYEKYPFYPDHLIVDEEKKHIIIKRNERLSFLTQKVNQLCKSWNIKGSIVMEVYNVLTQHNIPAVKKFIKKGEIQWILQKYDQEKITIFSDFVNRIQILPASEAAAERVFARMRDLYSYRYSNMKPETLKESLVINYNYSLEQLLKE